MYIQVFISFNIMIDSLWYFVQIPVQFAHTCTCSCLENLPQFYWPDSKASPVYELAKTVYRSVRLSVCPASTIAFSSCLELSSSQTINDTGVKLGEFVNIDEFFPTSTKFGDLDLYFALKWTHTDIDFSLFMNGLKVAPVLCF